MVSQKRKHVPVDSDSDSDLPPDAFDDDFSEDEVDISSALTGKKPKLDRHNDDSGGDDDEELKDIIRVATSKANVKGGTEMLKKTKGKSKIVKGEVGGGSFQSMGEYNP